MQIIQVSVLFLITHRLNWNMHKSSPSVIDPSLPRSTEESLELKGSAVGLKKMIISITGTMTVMYFGVKGLLWSNNMEGKIKPYLKRS